jgi:uncharacterized protein (DUF1697 family)
MCELPHSAAAPVRRLLRVLFLRFGQVPASAAVVILLRRRYDSAALSCAYRALPALAMTTCIALLRGVNVGRARRLAMADLRELVEGLGHTNVRTLLNSGNVVFDARRVNVGKIAQSVEAAITDKFGFSATVVVLTAADLGGVILENPLQAAATDPSKYLVAFVSSTTSLAKAKPLLARSWTPEALAVGKRAAYVWCANGIIESKLLLAFGRVTGGVATTRNWATILKLQAAASPIVI